MVIKYQILFQYLCNVYIRSFFMQSIKLSYPCNIFLLFLNILVSCNHTKTCVFWKKVRCMIVWFWYQTTSFRCRCYMLDTSISSIFHGFSQNCIVHQLEKNFVNFLLFSLALDSYQCMVLAKLFFQAFCVWNAFLSYKLTKSFFNLFNFHYFW